MSNGAFIYKPVRGRRRLVCTSLEMQAFVWPYIFTLFTPAARPMAQWASRNGTKLHPALRLVPMGSKGNGVVSLRALPAGTPLMSIPLRIGLASSREDRETIFLGAATPMEQLCHMFVRGLVDTDCPWKHYLEFLHDTHNFELEEDAVLGSDVGLQSEVDRLMDGNALVMKGVPNAPFLDKRQLTKAKHRVQWVRWQQAKRGLEQAVPHFASQAAAWAISMVLSRSVPAPEGERIVVPMLDLLNHSAVPTAGYHFSTPVKRGGVQNVNKEAGDGGVLHYDNTEAHCHITTMRAINPGDEITLKYSDESNDDEFWLLNWGFVPRRRKQGHLKKRRDGNGT